MPTRALPRLPGRLRGYLFFGVANAFSTRLHAAAASLDAGLHGEGRGAGTIASAGARDEASPSLSRGSGGGGGPLGARQQAAADRLYTRDSSKHGGALCAFATAPKFLLLVRG